VLGLTAAGIALSALLLAVIVYFVMLLVVRQRAWEIGTMIQKGNETVYLPALRGRTVSVTHVTEKGEKIARAIDVK
jgi:hypothetical protein